jgi:deoxycytidylate deaminase
MASKEALKSTFKKHRVGAVIVKGNRILSVGHNRLRSSAVTKTKTLHAEGAAILKLLKENRLHDLAGASLYVTRFTKSGAVGMAMPCPSCHALIKSVGISTVYYTTNEGVTQSYEV